MESDCTCKDLPAVRSCVTAYFADLDHMAVARTLQCDCHRGVVVVRLDDTEAGDDFLGFGVGPSVTMPALTSRPLDFRPSPPAIEAPNFCIQAYQAACKACI